MNRKTRSYAKVLSLLLAVCLFVGLLAGCSGEKAGDADTATTAAADTTAAAATTTAATTAAATTTAATTSAATTAAPETTAAGPDDSVVSLADTEVVYDGTSPVFKNTTEISWLCTNQSTMVYDFDNMTWCQAILDAANVELNLELLDSSVYSDVVKPRLAAGVDLPDVVSLAGNDQDMSYINSGIFAELTDYYDKDAYNLNWRFESNPTVKSQLTTPDGKIFYVPVIDTSVDYCPALLINFQWMEQVGKTVPTTTDEYYELLAAEKTVDFNGNGEADEWPLYLRPEYEAKLGSLWGLNLVLGYNMEDDGTVSASYIGERYLNYLQYMNRLYTEGLLYNEWSTSTGDIQNKLFSNNQVGSGFHYTANCQAYCSLIDPEWTTDDPMIIGGVTPPKGPYGDQYFLGLDPIAGMYGISRDCVNPEAVFCFFDYLYSEEANHFLYYGIEGTDYEVVDGKIVVDVELRNTDNHANNCGNNFGGFPRILLGEHRDTVSIPEIVERNAAIKPFYKVPIGFMFATPDQLDTVQAYATDLSTYWNEMRVSFITGSADLAAYGDYEETMKAMHIDDMIDVYAQYAARLG